MAATIARARGFTKDGDPRSEEATRLGGGHAEAQVATFATFADTTIWADGSGSFTLKDKHGGKIYEHRWGPEADR